ncbi:CynX/NimT family MFS transporter [Thalassospira permensis]|uniref:Cyanate transporter n=1 Tax=Thalassospira permensis NBRC 106175 TaxID=1353532 RepID=A0ABR4TRB7_9PROT|nr:MFS transporter [Thalassospira permensis]KEO58281.1 cyanate transporter [Thalassospira permensis NBRC 106175]
MTQNQGGVAPSEASPAVSPTQQDGNTRSADPAARGFRHLGPHIGFLLALLLLAANMRGSIVAMGPLAEIVGLDLQLSGVQLGLLTTIPVLSFGVLSIFAPRLGQRFGLEATLLTMLLFIAVGQGLRATGSYGIMIVGTIILGSAIAVLNVLTPSLVRRSFPTRVALITALYTFTMSTGATVAAFVAIPIRNAADGDWRYSLGIWAVFAALAFLLWLPMLRYRHKGLAPVSVTQVSLWKNAEAWWLALFFGCQSLMFYTGTAWVAKVFIDSGISEGEAATLLTIFNVFGIPAAFAAPLIYSKIANKKLAMVILHVPLMIGIPGFVFATTELPYLWAFCMGLGQGAMISIALTLVGIRGADPQTSARLSGMCQSVGYLLAAVGPVLFGALHDLLGNWEAALSFLFVIVCIQMIAALRAGSASKIGG